ncbi:MAG: LEPR-XLL domain-containing protein [Phycisphaerae bacterium]|nr:LEPR-XLL domain-containing protein [Phycisphaerae bacterium]
MGRFEYKNRNGNARDVLELEPLEGRVLLSGDLLDWTVITPLPLGLDGVATSVDENSELTVLYLESNTIEYTEADGDIFKISFRLPGTIAFTTNSVDDDGNVAGSKIGIDIMSPKATGSLKITDTNDDVGDGVINIQWLNITGEGFGSIKCPGDIAVLNAEGPLKTIKVDGQIDNAYVDGAIKNIKFYDDVNGTNIIADSIRNITAKGDLNSANILTDQGGVRSISVKGDMLDLDLDAAGEVKTIKVKGNLDGDISVDTLLGRVSAGGDITGISWNVIDDQNQGILGKLKAKGSITIVDLDVQGSIKKIVSGNSNVNGLISGSFSASGEMGSVKVFGDLDASLFSGHMFKSISVSQGDADNAELFVFGMLVDKGIIKVK